MLTWGPWRWSIMRWARMELSSSVSRCPTLAHFLHHHQLQSPVTWKLVRMSSIFYKWGVVTGVADLFFPLAHLLYAWVGLPATTAGWSNGSRSKYVIIHAEKSAPFTGGLRDCSEVFRLTETSVCSKNFDDERTKGPAITLPVQVGASCQETVWITFFFYPSLSDLP